MLMQCTRVENECEDRNGRIKNEDRTCDGFSRSISERRGVSLWLLEVPTEVSVQNFQYILHTNQMPTKNRQQSNKNEDFKPVVTPGVKVPNVDGDPDKMDREIAQEMHAIWQ